jgi:hypothetical protein
MDDLAGHRGSALSASALDLRRSLQGAGLAYLTEALDNPNLTEEHVALITRNRSSDEPLLRRIASDPRWGGSYEVKAGLARNPHTPRSVAMSMVKFLFWRDLASVAEDFLLWTSLRKTAEKILSDRIPEMALGERIALARVAGRTLHPRLLEQSEAQVLTALLWNGRMTEQDLVAAISRPGTPSETLGVMGRHPRWRDHYAIRLALVRQPHTPTAIALGFLTSLTDHDLNALSEMPETPRILALAARRILDDPYGQRHQELKNGF